MSEKALHEDGLKQENGCGCGCGHDHAHDHGGGDRRGIRNYIIRVIISVLLLLVCMVWPMVSWVQTALLLLSYIISGYEIIISAVKGMFKGDIFNEDFLMTLATIGAIVLGEYTEAVAVMVFFGVGEILEQISVSRSRQSITELMNIEPTTANVVRKGVELKVLPQEIAVGEIIRVKVGEKIPLDGVVVSGSSSLDCSSLTGESVLRAVTVGDSVLSGSINWQGTIEVQTKSSYDNSTVARIVKLLQESQAKKSSSEKFIKKFAKVYTPAVLLVAVIVAFVVPIFTGYDTLGEWVYKALTFLIISCPCALVVSIPMAFFAGVGAASRRGILVKGANFLEALNTVKTVVFDKTGTLTTGRFEVSGVLPKPEETPPKDEASLKKSPTYLNHQKDILFFAKVAEQNSNHPIAAAVLKDDSLLKAEDYNVRASLIKLTDSKEIPGMGVEVTFSHGEGDDSIETILAGNLRLMQERGISVDYVSSKTCLYIVLNGDYLGVIEFEDRIKNSSASAVGQLTRRYGIKTVMLSGDSERVVAEVAKKLSISRYFGRLLPHDKVNRLTEIIAEKPPKTSVMFVGDGINDAPVIALADIGVSMGKFGSQAAGEAADIILANDDISSVVTAISIARKVRTIVTQNIVFALGMKLATVALAIFGITSLWFAIFADVGVALIAIANSTRVTLSVRKRSSRR